MKTKKKEKQGQAVNKRETEIGRGMNDFIAFDSNHGKGAGRQT